MNLSHTGSQFHETPSDVFSSPVSTLRMRVVGPMQAYASIVYRCRINAPAFHVDAQHRIQIVLPVIERPGGALTQNVDGLPHTHPNDDCLPCTAHGTRQRVGRHPSPEQWIALVLEDVIFIANPMACRLPQEHLSLNLRKGFNSASKVSCFLTKAILCARVNPQRSDRVPPKPSLWGRGQ